MWAEPAQVDPDLGGTTPGKPLMGAEPAQVASDGRVLLKNVTFAELCGVG